jgi:hypothetical protein
MATVFRVVPGTPWRREDETKQPKDIRSRQLDELQRLSADHRKEIYGPNWDQEQRDFWHVRPYPGRTPTFRPKIQTPQLQTLFISEATDLTDSSIRIYVHNAKGRDLQREKAVQSHWRNIYVNNRLFLAAVQAMGAGTSFVAVGYDPLAAEGQGEVWVRPLDPSRCFPDHRSPYPEDWDWFVYTETATHDEIARRFPDHASEIRVPAATSENLAGPPAAGIELPPGPLSITVRGLPGGETYRSTGMVTVRYAYVRDMSVVAPTEGQKKEFIAHGIDPPPEYVPKYPNGRYLVDCEGTVLVDGDSWVPNGMMPFVPVYSMPPLEGVWVPAPMRYTKSLQEAAERLTTQTYENAVRLNNGFLVIREESGLTADSVGGLPGELMVVNANSPADSVKVIYPSAMPAQMTQMPLSLLELQRSLQGYSTARQGQPGAGNISADLFESAVEKGQSMTRMRARLFAESVSRVAKLFFLCMCKFYTRDRSFPSRFSREGMEEAKWSPVSAEEEFQCSIDERAIRPMSHARLERLAIELRKANAIDVKHLLEFVEVPEADEIAHGLMEEAKVAAAAKVQRR